MEIEIDYVKSEINRIEGAIKTIKELVDDISNCKNPSTIKLLNNAILKYSEQIKFIPQGNRSNVQPDN